VISGSLQGRIQGTFNTTDRALAVLGQTVRVTPSIIFDVLLANGVNSLANDILVEVHSVLNAVNACTRIETNRIFFE
jgi:hypothetical protein